MTNEPARTAHASNANAVGRGSIRLLAWVIIVTSLALGLRWYYVATAVVVNPVRGDGIQYYSYAWNLLHHHVFSMAAPGSAEVAPDSYRAPGYPLLLSAWMAITDDFGLWFAGVVMTQAVLGALTAGITVLLARFWLPLGWSVFAGLLVAAWPHSVTMASFLLSETLYGFLLLLGMLLYAWMLRGRRFLAAGLAGLCLGLAALTNPVLLPAIALLSVVAFWRGDAPGRLVLAFALCAALLPVAWEVRNGLLPLSAVASRDRAFQTLVIGSWPGFNAAWRESVGLEPDMARELPPAELKERMNAGRHKLESAQQEEQVMSRSPSEGLASLGKRFSASPSLYLEWYLIQKPALFWGWNIQIGQGEIYINPTKNSPFEDVPALRALVSLCHGLNPVIAISALIMVVLMNLGRHMPATFRGMMNAGGVPILHAVGWLFVYVTAMHTLLQAEPRYSIPYRAIEMLLAATAMAWLAAWYRGRRHRTNGIASAEAGRP